MYNEKHTENSIALLEQVKELLKESQSNKFYLEWADTFDIVEIDAKKIVIGYHGRQPLKKFKKECKDILWSKICMLVGYREKMKILKTAEHKENKAKNTNSKAKKNIKTIKFLALGVAFAFIAACFGLVMVNYIENRNFRETFYVVSSIKVNNRVRVVQLSDLHNCTYGENNAKLIERVEKLEPDIIICTGDIIDSTNPDTLGIEKLGKELSAVAPLYYIYGNNEVETVYDIPLNEIDLDKKFGFTKETRDETKLNALPDALEDKLEKAGFNVLKNEKDTINVGNTKIDVFGVLTSNPSSFWSYSEKSFANYIYEDTDNLKITAIHEPYIFEQFTPDYWGDLMICGHTHGGEIRVPVLGPLYTKEGGLFPERKDCYVYGRFDVAGRPLIVSSGLDNSSISRINNQPELVVIDINKF